MTKEQFLKMGALSRKDLKVLQILHAVFREPGISRSRLCDRMRDICAKTDRTGAEFPAPGGVPSG